MPDQDPRRPGRRLLLAGVGSALLLPVAGCGIRLEDDAPRLPLVPTRRPVPAEALLVALTRECDRLAASAARATDPTAAALAPLHARQHTVLRATLLGQGVPASGLDEPRPTASPVVTVSPVPVTSAALARLEAQSAAAATRFADVETSLLPTVAALHAQRYAAAVVLGVPVSVTAPRVSGTAAARPPAATDGARSLVQGGEARPAGSRRSRAVATLGALDDLAGDLVRPDQPAPALGRPLPYPVRTAADVDRLVTEVLGDLRATLGAELAGLTATDAAGGLAAASRWLGTVEVEAHRWGLLLSPFPGLR